MVWFAKPTAGLKRRKGVLLFTQFRKLFDTPGCLQQEGAHTCPSGHAKCTALPRTPQCPQDVGHPAAIVAKVGGEALCHDNPGYAWQCCKARVSLR